MSDGSSLYTTRAAAPDVADCYFYHSVDLPGAGTIAGEWDLRGNVEAYLGNEPLAGKRVLELGTASGYLCFEMERLGADVVGYDLDKSGAWDVVPFAAIDLNATAASRSGHIEKINNSWWFSHFALHAKARMVYGSVYDIPLEIGAVDICTFGAILLHIRDPLRALQSAAALKPSCIIVTEMLRSYRFGFLPERRSQRRSPLFLPNGALSAPFETWWSFSPESMTNLLQIVGYTTSKLTFHEQKYHDRSIKMFTIVAHPIER